MAQLSRRSILQGLTGAAAVGAISWAATGPASAAVGKTTTLRVLALNAWFGGTAVSGGVDMIVNIIKKSRASLVFLPEAKSTTSEIVQKLSDSGLPFEYRMSGSTAVLSAYPIAETSTLPFMTKAVVTVGTVQIAAYAAHLEYRWYATYLPRGYGPGAPSGEFSEYGWNKMAGGPVTDPATVQRINDASGRPDAMNRFIADARKELLLGRLVILGGDFNEPSALDWTEKTANLFDHNGVVLQWRSTQALKDAGFTDDYRKKYPDPARNPGFTWPASNPNAAVSSLTWAPEADERDRIDYLFHVADPRLAWRDTQLVGPRGSIVRNQRVDEASGEPFLLSDIAWPSDHKGVLSTFTLLNISK